MARRDKIGLAILIGLLALLCVIYVWTFKGTGGNAKGPADSVFVKQRMINLEKSK